MDKFWKEYEERERELLKQSLEKFKESLRKPKYAETPTRPIVSQEETQEKET